MPNLDGPSTLYDIEAQYEYNELDLNSIEEIHWDKIPVFGLRDSLRNKESIFSIFYPFVLHQFEESKLIDPYQNRTKLPGIKEIAVRRSNNNQWKFWIICMILLLIGIVRLSNENNFKMFIASVFNIKLSERIWGEQRYAFTYTILQLYLIYLFVGALFISGYLELKGILIWSNPLQQYGLIVLGLAIIYTLKFATYIIFGWLLQIKHLAAGFIANTVSINNLIALIVLPFIIFFTYNTHELYIIILSQVVISLFFLSIVYRIIRIGLLSRLFSGMSGIYLFIYLCALDVLPWFIIIHSLNSLQI
jgi:hypothetical protein